MTTQRRLRRRSWWVGVPGAVSLVVLIWGWLSVHFARRFLTPATRAPAGVLVHELVTEGATTLVWLSGPDAALDGQYSLVWGEHAGHAKVGRVVDRRMIGGNNLVARPVVANERGVLMAGLRGRITGWWFASPEELGFPVEHVQIAARGGSLWGWLIRPPTEGERPTEWAVHVHGRGALPDEVLRGVLPFVRAGIPSVVLAYRNDLGVPPGINGRYGLGLAEADDVDAAVSWCVGRGAARVSLFGWSMGATACLLAATAGVQRERVTGLVLDSPGIDWPGILRHHAGLAGLAKGMAPVAQRLMQHGWVRGAVPGARGTDLRRLTPQRFAEVLRVPVTILASPEDTFVPWEGAVQLQVLRPDLVTLHALTGEHVKLWNADPERWEAAVQDYVAERCGPPSKTRR